MSIFAVRPVSFQTRLSVLPVAAAILVMITALPSPAARNSYSREPQSLHPLFETPQHQEDLAFAKLTQSKSQITNLRSFSKPLCTQAVFEVLTLPVAWPNSLKNRLSMGLFARPGKYPTMVRFANFSEQEGSDETPDWRRLDMALLLPERSPLPNSRLDFTFLTTRWSHLNDSTTWAVVADLEETGVIKTSLAWGLGKVLPARRALSQLVNDKDHAPLGSLDFTSQRRSYFGLFVSRWGQFEAARYSLEPCPNNPAKPLTNHPDRLRQELRRHLLEDSVTSCFDFKVQLLETQNLLDERGRLHRPQEWAENAGLEWSEARAPKRTLGRLQLKSQSVLSQEDCRLFQFLPMTNTTPDHQGLGSLARSLRQLEQAVTR